MPRDLLANSPRAPARTAPRDLLAAPEAYTQPAPPEGMQFDPATGQMFDPALRAEGMKVNVPAYSGAIVPFSREAGGEPKFDSNAGLLGAITRAFNLPSEVLQGKIDPNSDEAIGRAVEFATVASPVNPAVRIGERAIPGATQALRREQPPVPSAEALKDASSAGYNAVRDAGVDYKSDAVRTVAEALQRNLEGDGILGELAPKTFKILDRLTNPPEGSVAPIAGIEAARRSFGNAAKDFSNPTEQLAAKRAVQGLDEFIERADPSAVVSGSAEKVASALRDARGNYAASKRSDTLTGIGDAAELRAAAANSGQNLDNSTRQRLVSLLLDKKRSAGFSAAEREAIEQVARGSGTANFLRGTGNMLGGGGGLGSMVSGSIGGALGSAVGGVPGAAIGATLLPSMGAGMKKVAAALTQRGLSGADEMTRMRSPLYDQAIENAPMVAESAEGRAALLRALLAIEAESR